MLAVLPQRIYAHKKEILLFRGYEVELARAFLVEQGAFGFVAAAPMFVATWDGDVFAWANTLFAGFILVQVSAFDDHAGHVVGVGVPAGVEAGLELGERGVGAFFWVAAEHVHGGTAFRPRRISDFF